MIFKNLALEYFNAFSNKDVTTLQSMFDTNITLRDWEINESGVSSVIEANTKIFDSVDTIKVTPVSLYQEHTVFLQEHTTVVAELEILINNVETILVTDIITFNNLGKILSIKAYKG
jgi:hypothetical protein